MSEDHQKLIPLIKKQIRGLELSLQYLEQSLNEPTYTSLSDEEKDTLYSSLFPLTHNGLYRAITFWDTDIHNQMEMIRRILFREIERSIKEDGSSDRGEGNKSSDEVKNKEELLEEKMKIAILMLQKRGLL